jgi:hypothetical protein
MFSGRLRQEKAPGVLSVDLILVFSDARNPTITALLGYPMLQLLLHLFELPETRKTEGQFKDRSVVARTSSSTGIGFPSRALGPWHAPSIEATMINTAIEKTNSDTAPANTRTWSARVARKVSISAASEPRI